MGRRGCPTRRRSPAGACSAFFIAIPKFVVHYPAQRRNAHGQLQFVDELPQRYVRLSVYSSRYLFKLFRRQRGLPSVWVGPWLITPGLSVKRPQFCDSSFVDFFFSSDFIVISSKRPKVRRVKSRFFQELESLPLSVLYAKSLYLPYRPSVSLR
jgi:hypothetical protein